MATGDDGRRGEGASPSVAAPTLSEHRPGASPHVDVSAETAAATPADLAAASEPGASTAPSAWDDDLVGSVLEQRYEVTRQIGQGGMGAVFEATHKLIGKRVAVKVLLPKYAGKDSLVARLEQEARLASSIGHPNIIDITDFGRTPDGRTYVVMEFLDGESLGGVITRIGKLDVQRAIHVGRQIAGALGAAHEKGVVHRDLKPENVFLVRRNDLDFVKVVDFGISKLLRHDQGEEAARLTQTGMVLGTPLYMSPEQARGDEQLDHRIDVYALGVILFEMVTGEVPFRGTNYLNILSQVVSDAPPSPRAKQPAIPIELEAIILKALEKDPDHRYQSMAEIAADLALLAAGDVSPSSTGARVSAMRRRARRGRRPLGLRLVAIAVVVGAAAIAIGLAMRGDASEAPSLAPAGPVASTTPAPAVDGPTTPSPLTPEPLELTIQSKPPGADLYEGDRYLGKTPQVLRRIKRDEMVELFLEKGALSGSLRFNPVEVDPAAPLTVRLTKDKAARRRGDRGAGDRGRRTPAADDTAGGDLTGDPHRD